MLAHHVFPISEVAGRARQSSSEDRAAGGNAAPRSTIDPSDRIVRVSERQSFADGVCYCEAFCCMHVCVNVSSPAGRRVPVAVRRPRDVSASLSASSLVGRTWAPARTHRARRAPRRRSRRDERETERNLQATRRRSRRGERTLTLTIAISHYPNHYDDTIWQIWRRGRLTVSTPGRWAHCAPGPG